MGGVRTALVLALVAARAGMAAPYERVEGYRTQVTAAARRGAGCSTAIGSNVYRCTVTPESGAAFEDCLRFLSPGDVSDRFDLTPDQLGITLGCTCKAAGSSRRPRFQGSAAFECTADDFAFEGVVRRKGKSIANGFASTAAGASFIFGCRIDPACAVVP
jgi:hypothetical protein